MYYMYIDMRIDEIPDCCHTRDSSLISKKAQIFPILFFFLSFVLYIRDLLK